MDGTINFDNLADLATFLKEFTGCTAKFTVEKIGETKWVLTFTGGY
jgi:hypothetical protein